MKSSLQKIFLSILLFGLISLFGDLIYESARSINGQYLLLLGATASIIGFFIGLGEFLSNFLRFVFGFLADRIKNYWLFIFIGYFFLIFVPLMFFANSWQIAILFIIFERIGKAIRNPARDTIVSIISERTKSIGFNFGI
ncbi:MAG: MFS transporter, partial [Candidatus Aenigmatarchaeota archaeon]